MPRHVNREKYFLYRVTLCLSFEYRFELQKHRMNNIIKGIERKKQ